MGTRADFYIGRGQAAEWLGSVAWDGYPSGFDETLFEAKSAEDWRQRVIDEFYGRDDATRPEDGWPWPWDDSCTTDYAYAFDGGSVHASCFGSEWFDPRAAQPDDVDGKTVAKFPNMASRRKIAEAGTKRSGVIMLGARRG